MRSRNSLNNSENINEIAENLIEFSNQRAIYDRIHFLDKRGDKIIKIIYDNNKAYSVKDSKLKNKKDIYYFIKTGLIEKMIFMYPL